jgi:hypothetical protein
MAVDPKETPSIHEALEVEIGTNQGRVIHELAKGKGALRNGA